MGGEGQLSLLPAMAAANRAPVLAAWGAGWDSTAMLIELVERGEPVDHALFADTGSEKAETYAFVGLFSAWLRERGVPVTVVRYEPRNFKNFPAYRTLDENCLTNGTLPSIAFGFGSCSQKWKIAPQNKWAESWAPARRVWSVGGRVVKLIGYDCSPADVRRYAEQEGYDDPRYEYRYPLREWGWVREDCRQRILAAGLPLPPKSACYMCSATKPDELRALAPEFLRRIVLMEARAKPRLRNTEGLWRKAVKGTRGGTPKPGMMTTFIRDEAPAALVSWQEAMAKLPASERPTLDAWLRQFGRDAGLSFDPPGVRPLYSDAA